MNPEEFAAVMKEISAHDDIKASHCLADDLLCSLLRQHGYTEGVEIFEKMDKWYA